MHGEDDEYSYGMGDDHEWVMMENVQSLAKSDEQVISHMRHTLTNISQEDVSHDQPTSLRPIHLRNVSMDKSTA